MGLWLIRLALLGLILVAPAQLPASTISGSIDKDATWSSADSPVDVTGTLTVARGTRLTIAPGVVVRFAEGVSLYVEGELVARGTAQDSIRFTSAGEQAPRAWGGISITAASERPSWDEAGNYGGEGSVLEFCIVEFGGRPSLDMTSTVDILASSPLITHSTIRQSAGETGTIRCGNLGSVYISDSDFIDNEAIRGGALSLGFGSQSQLFRNRFIGNRAQDNAGAIYITHCASSIAQNIFVSNHAGGHGGAIYAAITSEFNLHHNSFLYNRSEFDSHILYLTDKIVSNIHHNLFDTDGYAIYLENAANDIQASNNWWGVPGSSLQDKVHDRFSSVSEPYVFHDSPLWAPPDSLPTNPDSIREIILCRSDDYEDEIPYGVAEGAPLRIRVTAEDADPYAADLIAVKVVSIKDPQGIIIPLRETEPNSGVFLGRGDVEILSNQKQYTIGDDIGGNVAMYAPFASDVVKKYETMSPRPLVEDFTIADTPDLQHVTEHALHFTWTYFEVVKRPQTHYDIQIYSFDSKGNMQEPPVWDSGEVKSSSKDVLYAGRRLQDGKSYRIRIRVYSGYLWSDPAFLDFRMNSLPTAPVTVKPATDELIGTFNPQIVIDPARDTENDSLTYTFEVYLESDLETAVQTASEVQPKGNAVSWTVPGELIENEHYMLRSRAVDAFEPGPWGEFRLFHINTREENPANFDLLHPVESFTTYLLHPTLSWQKAPDPDPLSSVTYTIEIAEDKSFETARTYEGIEPLEFMLPDSLDNRMTYHWRVIAVDNTGLMTVSSSTGDFYVDTTPSIPVVSATLEEEEQRPGDPLEWLDSSDPDSTDLVFYEVEVYHSREMNALLAHLEEWEATRVRIDRLEGWGDLVDNEVYYWRVRARDNHNADSKFSEVGSFFYNRYNDNPDPVPTISAPLDTVRGTTDVRFAWNAASDVDKSDPPATLDYEIEAAVGGDFNAGDVKRFTTDQGITELTGALDDDRLWHYRIRSRDDEGAVSVWSPVDSVLVNSEEDEPALFALLHPVSDSLVVELDSLTFHWEASSDVDWGSSIRYRFELYPDQRDMFAAELDETSYTFRDGLINEWNYRWRVIAIDNTGLETVCEQDNYFATNTTPTVPAPTEIDAELLPHEALAFTGASDPNKVDVLTYTLEVAVSDAFAKSLIHVVDLPHFEGIMQAVLNSLEGFNNLEDDRDYYYRIRATDNHGYDGAFSSSKGFRFNQRNDLPTIPGAPYAPSDSIVMNTLTPQLSWNPSNDEDLSDPVQSLQYEIRLDTDSEFEKGERYTYTTSPGHTTFSPTTPLDDNNLWSWQVRARDDEGAVSDWSPTQQMLVNVKEDPPTTPMLTSPKENQNFNILGPIEFAWIASEDVDYRSSISYRLEYSLTGDMGNALTAGPQDNPTAVVEGPLNNTTYYWRVVAIDNTGLETPSSVSSFTLDTRPTVPQPLAPLAQAELLPTGELSWSASTDPNPEDQVRYTLQLAPEDKSKAGNATIFYDMPNLAGTTIKLSDARWNGEQVVAQFGDNIVCHWRVKATDNHGIVSAWSEPVEFIFNLHNDPPLQVADLTQPEKGMEVATINLAWQPVEDPDPTDPSESLSYEIEFSRNEQFIGELVRQGVDAGIAMLQPDGITDNMKWYWRVRAVDDEGMFGSWSRIGSFIYNSVNDAPSRVAVLLTPANGAEVSSIDLSWQAANDPDPTDPVKTLEYVVDFALDSTFNTGLATHQSGAGVAQMQPTGLADNTTWYWRVRAMDDDGVGGANSPPGVFTYNAANEPPLAVPGLLEPEDGLEASEVTLSWMAASDPDPFDSTGGLSYQVELSTDSNFSGGSLTYNTQTGETSLAQPDALTDNSVWYWRVRAVDDEGMTGEASRVSSFALNRANDPPRIVRDLLAPQNGTEVEEAQLEWSAATDPDPSDLPETLSYLIELAQDRNFNGDVVERTTRQGATSITVDGLDDNVTWYWRVKAVDNEGAEGQASRIASFVYNSINDAPEQFGLDEPGKGEIIDGTTVTFRWGAANDPDPSDRVSYTLIIGRDPSFVTGVRRFDSLEVPHVTLNDRDALPASGAYYWKVSAQDGKGGITWGSSSDEAPWTFTLRLPEKPATTTSPGQHMPEQKPGN